MKPPLVTLKYLNIIRAVLGNKKIVLGSLIIYFEGFRDVSLYAIPLVWGNIYILSCLNGDHLKDQRVSS